MSTIDFSEQYQRTSAPFAIDRTGGNSNNHARNFIRPIGTGSIEYVLSGKGTIIENNKNFQVKAGDVFILHARNYHEYYPDPDDPWEKVWVQLSGHLVPEVLKAYNLSNINLIPNFNLEEDIRNIAKIINNDTDIETIDLQGPRLFLELVQKIHKELCRREITLQEPTTAEKIRTMIDSIPDGYITTKQLCAESNFSERHLNRIFKEQYGITPNEYILNRRIAIVQSLLKRTNLPMKKIAEKLHFCSASYLSKFFREQTGETPLEYRKKYKS